ncbi:SDR family oxidoreductase [Streptomyces sp. NPDC047043]|uniref:SDR family NAD(P)-dependent oxidoreductase n=1 Tax=Streptomyces sp. NPDC047043 TaxID=3154497 RepID=UPI0033C89ED3
MPLPKPNPTSTAIVTGASSGIGADIARELARRGHGVTLVARREDRLRDLATELTGTVRVEVIACDVADAEQRARLFDTVAERGLTADILVNNAGIGTIDAVANSPVEAEIAQVRVNVEAVIDLTTRAVQQMVPRRRGAILNVGSVSGFIPQPGQSGYAGTKAFVQRYSEGLRAELAGTGVTVAVLCPGPVHTEFVQSAGLDSDGYPPFLYMPSRDVARIGVDALEGDRGVVVAGLAMRIVSSLMRLTPRRLLLPALVRQNPGLKRARA